MDAASTPRASIDPRSLAAARALEITERTLFVELRDQPALDEVTARPQGAARRVAAWQALSSVSKDNQQPILDLLGSAALRDAVGGVAALASPNLIAIAPAKLPDAAPQGAATPDPRAAILAATAERPEVANVWQLADNGGFELVRGGAPIQPVAPPPTRLPPGIAPGRTRQLPNGAGLTYGLVDSGFDAKHWSLKGAWRGGAFNPDPSTRDRSWFDTTEAASPTPRDYETHGTSVASIAVGRDLPSGAGSVSSLVVAATKAAGTRDHAWRKLLGISWMQAPTTAAGLGPNAAAGPDVVGISFGVQGDPHLLQRAIGNLTAAGTDVVVSAGNGGTQRYNALGAAPGAYSVGASTIANTVWGRSSRGNDQHPDKPDFVAWGTTVPVAKPNGGMSVGSGTSYAQPRLASVLLALRSARPDLTQDQQREVLRAAAVQVRDAKQGEHNRISGWGTVSAKDALREAKSRFPMSPAGSPKTP